MNRRQFLAAFFVAPVAPLLTSQSPRTLEPAGVPGREVVRQKDCPLRGRRLTLSFHHWRWNEDRGWLWERNSLCCFITAEAMMTDDNRRMGVVERTVRDMCKAYRAIASVGPPVDRNPNAVLRWQDQ